MHKLLVPAALAMIGAFGITEGLWTNRWSVSKELELATANLRLVPPTFGEWVGQDFELDKKQVARAEMSGYVLRQYTHKNTGATVRVLLVCGPPGPTSLHSPDICYQGVGYQMDAPPAKHTVKMPVPASPSQFWLGRFQKNGPDPEPLRIYWSWSSTGTWVAADNPRWTFGGSPFLYKLYVIRSLPRLDEKLAEDPSTDFMREFLPELRKKLFTNAGQIAWSAPPPVPGLCLLGRWS